MRNTLAASFLACSCALAAHVTARACDTWVALPDVTADGAPILAKNSDRPTFDAQPLVFYPRQSWPADAAINAGRITIPQARETFATLGSSPYWCWGYEEGINEFSVAIGNEGIRTRPLLLDLVRTTTDDPPQLGLTGMDLVRLGLERARTAREALDVITSLLETHGQFGSGLPTMQAAAGAYDNSYIIADPAEAWVLETAGRQWVARRLESGSTSISNTPTITTDWDLASHDLVSYAVSMDWWPAETEERFDFTRAYADDTATGLNQRRNSVPRAECSSALLAQRHGDVDTRWMMRIARDESSTPPINLDGTASSCVAVLPNGADQLPVFWWAPAVPSDSCFIPFFVHASSIPDIVSRAGAQGSAVRPPSEVEADAFADDSLWWTFRQLRNLAAASVEDRTPEIRRAFDALEEDFAAGLPDLLETATALRAEGRTEEAADLLSEYTSECVSRALETARALTTSISESATETIPPEFAPFVGDYHATFKDEMHRVLVKGGRLAVDIPGQMVIELLDPDESGRRRFSITDQVSASFAYDDAGNVIGLTYHQGGMDLELLRDGYEPPVEITAEQAAPVIGDYRFEPANLDAHVYVDHGRLVAEIVGQLKFVLRANDEPNEWTARATDLITVGFRIGEDGAAEVMTMRQAGRPVVFERVASQ
jgi:secernin